MYIENIEIYGFKTFVNNTKFILSKGITCIVGPNGSGKSNIVDAIRFLFGENRLSLLRATELSYLIFAGSESRPPMNVASVKVVINNEDRLLSVKTPRVIIERRLIRGNVSRYFVNGEESSLQGVLEIFRSANIFGLNHAIVGQGRIEEIILAKPEEKKNLLDRVAGIENLRKKRDEARKKLEETEENLSKVKAILNSKKEEYERVLREAKKVHIYYTLSTDVRNLEEKLFNLRLKKLRETLNALVAGLEEKKKEEESVHARILKKKEEFEGVHIEVKKLEELLEDYKRKRETLLIKKANLSKEIDSLKNLIDLKNGEITELNVRKEKLERTKSYVLLDIERINGTIKKLKDDLELVLRREKELRKNLEESTSKLAPLEAQYNEFKKQLEERQSKRIQIERKISAFEREHDLKKRRLVEIDDKIKALEKIEAVDVEDLKKQLNEIETSLLNFKNSLESLEKEKAILDYRIKVLKASIDSAKIPSFKEGTLGKMLNIDKNLFGLKDYLDSVIVEDFVSLKNMPSKRFFLNDFEDTFVEPSSELTPISTLLNKESKFLHGIYYAKSVEEGIKIFREYFNKTFIRMIITGDGFVVLSPFEVEKQGGLSIDEAREYEALLKEQSNLVNEISKIKETVSQLEAKRKSLVNQIEIGLENLKKINEREELKKEFFELSKESDTLKATIEMLKIELKETISQGNEFDDSELVKVREDISKIKDELSKTLISKKELEIRIENSNKEINDLERRVKSIERDLEELQGKKEFILKEIEDKNSSLNLSISSLNELELDLMQVEKGLKELNAKFEELKFKEGSISIEIDELTELKESIHKDVEKIELSIAKEETNVGNLLEEMKEKGFKEGFVPQDVREEELKTQIYKLKHEIEGLMPLDFTSVDKEEEVRRAFESNNAVYEDVVSAKKELEKYLSELDFLIKERFEKTFDNLSKEFEKIFLEIFEGGSATLEKILDENSEVSGIEISVQLPFKRKQPLHVLSGGEKSLVALAFLFAIFEVNPSPFYVLDEVDAALDDENVYKFGKLLERVSKKSQLIIITHNKQTMEKADILYGITMEEDGISKVVSLKLV